MKSLLIPVLVGLLFFTVLQFVGFQAATAGEDKKFKGGYEVLAENIVQIDGKLFFISHPYQIQSVPNIAISFHNVNFTLPHDPSPPVPGGIRSTTVIFQDGVTENLSKGVSGEIATIFSDHSKPTAGFSRHPDNSFYFLVSVDSESPLKQFKSGISSENVKCKDDLKLVIKMDNHLPACVKPTSVSRLLTQGWNECCWTVPLE